MTAASPRFRAVRAEGLMTRDLATVFHQIIFEQCLQFSTTASMHVHAPQKLIEESGMNRLCVPAAPEENSRY